MAAAELDLPRGPTEKEQEPLLPCDAPSSSSTAGSAEALEATCAPFARRDAHGPAGRGELPPGKKALIALAFVTLVPVRLLVGTALVLLYYATCWFCTLFCEPSPEEEEEGQGGYGHLVGWRREVIVRTGRLLSRAVLFVMGFYSIPEDRRETSLADESDECRRPQAIISNHVSYIDVLYHMSSSFPSFVAKRSVAKLPLVGIISKCLGCVYVQRESKSSDSKGVAGVVIERIRRAHENEWFPMLMIFPEGTTTNGEFLLPFKRGAFLAKAPVRPVILKYPYERFSPAWESISGVRHMLLLLCQVVNHLEATHLPVYYPSQQEKDDPKLYANNVRKLMAAEGNLMLSEIGLAEKRVYLGYLDGKVSPDVLHQKDD